MEKTYEVVYEYSDGVFSRTKESSLFVKASNDFNAKNSAMSVLKAQHSYVSVKRVKECSERLKPVLKQSEPINGKYNSHVETGSTKSIDLPSMNSNAWIVPMIVAIVICLIIGCVFASIALNALNNVEGKYYMTDIRGTHRVSADYTQNYIIMDGGKGELHISLIEPKGETVVRFGYSVKNGKIVFDRESLTIDEEGNIILKLNYENGNFIFTYKKENENE